MLGLLTILRGKELTMPRSFTDRALTAAALGALLALSPVPERKVAQAFVCVNCSTNIQQMIEYAAQVRQLAEQTATRVAQARMLSNQIQNMVSIPGSIYTDVANNIRGIQALMRQGSHLSLNAGMVSSQLNGYTSYITGVIDMPANYARWSRHANDNLAASLSSLGLMQNQMSSERAVADAIRLRARSAQGLRGVLEANTEMGGQAVAELHQLRQIMLADAQMSANALHIEADRRAVDEAQLYQFLNPPVPPIRGNPRW